MRCHSTSLQVTKPGTSTPQSRSSRVRGSYSAPRPGAEEEEKGAQP